MIKYFCKTLLSCADVVLKPFGKQIPKYDIKCDPSAWNTPNLKGMNICIPNVIDKTKK